MMQINFLKKCNLYFYIKTMSIFSKYLLNRPSLKTKHSISNKFFQKEVENIYVNLNENNKLSADLFCLWNKIVHEHTILDFKNICKLKYLSVI